MLTQLISWPAPAGEVPSPDYSLTVDGSPVFVYQARVRAEILEHEGLWTHTPDCPGERASFAMFDMGGPVTVSVRPSRPFITATVLPARAEIAPVVEDGVVRFTLDQPWHLTLLLDGSDAQPLHLFIGAPETDIPAPDDPNVIYFGPGVHEVESLHIRDGQTVYLAGGAVVKAVLKPGETGTYNEKWKVTFFSGVVLDVTGVHDVRIAGRGILDGSLIPHPGRKLIRVADAHGIHLGGIVLRDAPNWNVIISGSHDVEVDDLRIISGRLNSDGINSVNSQRIRIRRCFVRNHDDSIVVKTVQPELPAADVRVEDCQLWDDWGYAMGVTYETRATVNRVSYHRCDVLFVRHWCMGVRVSDSATISDVSFHEIGIADFSGYGRLGGARNALSTEPLLLYLSIAQDCWGHDEQRGRIRNVTLDGVTIDSDYLPPSLLEGFDDEHDIRGITLRNVRLRHQLAIVDANALKLRCGQFVRDLVIEE